MLRLYRRFGWLKKAFLILSLVAFSVVAYSGIYNYPIRFREKYTSAPDSQAAWHVSKKVPDNIVVTVTPDMTSSMALTWRTSSDVADGVVQYMPLGREDGNAGLLEAPASVTALFSDELLSDKAVNCHSATLAGLKPGTAYRYRVGSASAGAWSEYRVFSTLPEAPDSFTFAYYGDVQVGPESFGKMLRHVEKEHPEVQFHMIGGDLVDRGELRNLWDDFMRCTSPVFSRKPLAPVMGNHDFGRDGVGARYFNAYFAVPGRDELPPESPVNYGFQAGGVYFLVVNGGDPEENAQWLGNELRLAEASGCDFKMVVHHYPLYTVKLGRKTDPEDLMREELWTSLFDAYDVDLMLAGHDHSYMRSKPMAGGRPVGEGEPGTVHIVANGGDKHSKFKQLDISEMQFTGEATYQLITVTRDRQGRAALRYAAYDDDGELRDEMRIDGKSEFLRAGRKTKFLTPALVEMAQS